jgi:hypothetical protein
MYASNITPSDDITTFTAVIAYMSYVELNVVSISAVAAELAVTVDKYVQEPPAGVVQVGAEAPAEVNTCPAVPAAPVSVSAVVMFGDANVSPEVKDVVVTVP